MPAQMGRKQINGAKEQIPARFPAGTKARIKAALAPKESAAKFIRDLVEVELQRRERQKP